MSSQVIDNSINHKNTQKMRIEISHYLGDRSFKEVFLPDCFGDKTFKFTFNVLEEEWIHKDGTDTRIIKKAELLSVEETQLND